MNFDQTPDHLQNPYAPPMRRPESHECPVPESLRAREPESPVSPQPPKTPESESGPNTVTPQNRNTDSPQETANSQQLTANNAPEGHLLQTTPDLTLLPPRYASDKADFADVLSKNAEEILIQRISGDSEGERDCIRDYLRTMEIEILRKGSSAMEVLLARRVVYCFASLQYFETLYLQTMTAPRKPMEHAFELVRLNQASARYLSALQTLANVRKLKGWKSEDIDLKKILQASSVFEEIKEEEPDER